MKHQDKEILRELIRYQNYLLIAPEKARPAFKAFKKIEDMISVQMS